LALEKEAIGTFAFPNLSCDISILGIGNMCIVAHNREKLIEVEVLIEVKILNANMRMCYRTVCSSGQRLKDRDQTGVTGTFPNQCHLDGEVLSV
jgi:hypothetical protein